MNSKEFALVLSAFICSGTTLAAEQFVCSFGDRVKFDSNKVKSPTAKVVPSSERYTFILRESGEATYIPPDGIAGQLFVVRNDEIVSLVEKNQSNNLFVVTIFKGKANTPYRAVYTLHGSPDDHPFFWPHTSLGACRHIVK